MVVDVRFEKTFTPPANPTLYRITFPADSKLADLEMVVYGSTVGEAMAFKDSVAALDGPGGYLNIRGCAEIIAGKLVGWNHSVFPADLSGLLSFEWPDLYAIVREYAAVTAGVGDPLERPSTDGAQSAEESTQMEMSLASLSS